MKFEEGYLGQRRIVVDMLNYLMELQCLIGSTTEGVPLAIEIDLKYHEFLKRCNDF